MITAPINHDIESNDTLGRCIADNIVRKKLDGQ